MKFTKVGDNTVRCKITEEEISELGYSIDEIMVNGKKTQEFMDHILAMAEENCHVTFDSGIRTVRADLCPDHSLVLTFSRHSPEGLMDQLKELVSGLSESGAFAEEEQQENAAPSHQKVDLEETPEILVLLEFCDMDHVIRFAKQMPKHLIPANALLKYKKKYYIRIDLTDFSEEQVRQLSMITDEYVEVMLAGSARSAFIEEHGEVLMKEKAIESLKQL